MSCKHSQTLMDGTVSVGSTSPDLSSDVLSVQYYGRFSARINTSLLITDDRAKGSHLTKRIITEKKAKKKKKVCTKYGCQGSHERSPD